jgi:hypothetical protein
MSIRSHLETAEEALRQALINALAEKQDTYLTQLYEALGSVKDILLTTPVDPKPGDMWLDNSGNISIRTTDKVDEWGERWKQYNFELNSEYLNSPDTISFNTPPPSGDTIINFPNDRISLGLD